MSLETFPSCIAAYYTDSSGVNGSNELVDQTAHGNNLTLVTGTPQYATRSSVEMMNWDNTFYFEGDCPLLPGGSVVFVGQVSLAGTEGTSVLIANSVRKANAGNYDAVPDDAAISDFLSGSSYRINQILVSAARVPSFFSASANAAGTAFTNDQINIFTCAARGNPAQYEASTKTQTKVTASIASAFAAMSAGGMMRIGCLKTTFPTNPFGVNRYISTKRIYFFNENVFDNSAFSAARDAEIAQWGI